MIVSVTVVLASSVVNRGELRRKSKFVRLAFDLSKVQETKIVLITGVY